MAKRRLIYVPIDALPSADVNPKAHDTPSTRASIDRFGFIEPTIVDERTGKLVAGHGRRDTLIEMHAAGDDVPDGIIAKGSKWLAPLIVGWSSKDDNEAHAAGVALNHVGEGLWDLTVLAPLLADLESLESGLDGLGYTADDLLIMQQGLREPSRPWDREAAAALPKVDVKPGDIFDVGKHIIVCGDSRDPAVLERVLVGEQVAAVVTDPPYGVDYGGGGGKARQPIEGDSRKGAVEFAAAWVGAAEAVSAPGAVWYVFSGSDSDSVAAIFGALNAKELVRWSIVWVKDRATFSRADFHWQHELIWYGWKAGAGHAKIADRTVTSVLEFPRPHASEDHPTAKPVELMQRLVEWAAPVGGLVLEPFGGSGSTAVACERLGRRCVAIETVPAYVDVIVRRVAEAASVEPVRRSRRKTR